MFYFNLKLQSIDAQGTETDPLHLYKTKQV